MEALGFETISLRLLPWRSVARRIGGWILRQPTTRTGGLLTTRLVAACVLAVRWRDLSERRTAKGHHQCHHDRCDQRHYALPHRFSPPFPCFGFYRSL
jgi:hypothetical protein